MKQTIQKQQVPFAQISNELLNDTKISLKAKGVYAFMYSKPDGWNFTIKSMSKQLKEGEDAIKHAIQELKEFGWCIYNKHQDGTGSYDLLTSPKVENPHGEKPLKGKSPRISNKEPLIKPIDSTFSFSLKYSSQYDSLSRQYREELHTYILIKDKTLAEAFYDHHRSKGSKYKNWSLAFNTWCRNDKKFNESKQPKGSSSWEMPVA